MVILEDKNCNQCGKKFAPKVFWQKFCPKKKGEVSCHDKYWKEVYKEKADTNKRLDTIEEKLNIK